MKRRPKNERNRDRPRVHHQHMLHAEQKQARQALDFINRIANTRVASKSIAVNKGIRRRGFDCLRGRGWLFV